MAHLVLATLDRRDAHLGGGVGGGGGDSDHPDHLTVGQAAVLDGQRAGPAVHRGRVTTAWYLGNSCRERGKHCN